MSEHRDMSCEINGDDLYENTHDNDVSYDNSVQNNELTASAIGGGENTVDASKPHDQKEGVKMKNDLQDTGTAVRSDVFMEIAEISKYKFERAKARQWATRDICFLVYDDSDVKIDGFDSDDEEAQQEYALRMSLGDGDIPASEGDKPQRSEYSDDSWKAKCRVCAWYPEFPHKWKPRKFRLVNPTVDHPAWFDKGADGNIASIDICMHYVAVSYCWPPRDEKPIPRSYTVRDLDGRLRTSRALDDVLDRAVDFANSCGLRMIWIDQECLPQPTEISTKEDWAMQELGIQSMDIVYNRAMYTAGLLNVEITSQEQLDAIDTLLRSDWETTQKNMNPRYCEHILRLLHETCQDRWYTRAWVIQEAICAGLKLVLAFRCNSGLSVSSKFRYGYKCEVEDRPYHSLDDHARGLDSTLSCISVSEFWRMLDVMQEILLRDFSIMGSMLVRSDYAPADLWPGARSVLQAAESLHPRTVKANTLQQAMMTYSEGQYGKRPTINAAGALTLLKHRQCYFESDRLAIIANMCDYDFRLDTKAIDDNFRSLRLAILALALNNGDLSLLAPEAYPPPDQIYSDDAYAGHASSSLLFQNFFLEAPWIEHCQVRDFVNTRIQTVQPGSVTPDGVLLNAYLWSVDREIDFTLVQSTWADAWESLRCWRLVIDRQKSETLEQYHARNATITQWFSRPGVSQRALKDFRQFGHIPDNSAVWESVDHRGVQVMRYIDCYRVKQVPEMQNLIARIIFDILRYTLTITEEGALARGLANSIWQSIRIDQVPGSEDPLPDEVGDALFSHVDVLTRPFATLQLEETLDKTFAQLWFVDRIMKTGKLWCGTYMPPGGEDGIASHIDSSSQFTAEMESGVGRVFGKSPTDTHVSIIDKQIRRQMFTMMLQGTSAVKKQPLHWRWPLVVLTEVVANRDYWSRRGERRRKETLLSTFDVDGPCQVATPYNPEWEILPRPTLRSMRVCWVVEEKNTIDEVTIATSEKENISSNPLLDTANSDRPGLAEGKGKERASDRVREVEAPQSPGSPDTNERFGNQGLNLQVLRKVKGLWQIMDLPRQDYVFS
ncbi:hypothetical protein COCMIDRAFT_30544 [Bipolaris oryzae ATCC 44560]|uniref:Heterokaryon incompatibility domain-containing protein n=1 Tax=Bipolaris oryzae ATCC 44560 TaxID=930090 RepID=W6Z9Z6_COCMI|nr:uncharacterized protein COCMIDRAFT_30544 [Bipolaris oryzae ATCC 44560]EUC40536.1 hypothetical protein COCMIDRAFT_30544 [Bipolaris oryzae ATCC 44560]